MRQFKLTFINCYNETCTSIETAQNKKSAKLDFYSYAPECKLISIEKY